MKVHVGGERIVAAAEGNGPVNALDARAARRHRAARSRRSPASTSPTTGCGSSTPAGARVRSPASSSTPPTASATWTTIGVSENIIEASWQALYDSIVFGLLHAA